MRGSADLREDDLPLTSVNCHREAIEHVGTSEDEGGDALIHEQAPNGELHRPKADRQRSQLRGSAPTSHPSHPDCRQPVPIVSNFLRHAARDHGQLRSRIDQEPVTAKAGERSHFQKNSRIDDQPES